MLLIFTRIPHHYICPQAFSLLLWLPLMSFRIQQQRKSLPFQEDLPPIAITTSALVNRLLTF